MPGLLVEAQRRAPGDSDNLTVVAMTWENQDDPRVADTASARRRGIRHLDQHHRNSTLRRPGEDVTDDDIERAIAEIQNAIAETR